VGSFAEDISMYRQRNPEYNLKKLMEEILKTDFDKALIKSYLIGRTLWCASHLAEIIPKTYDELVIDILNLAKKTLIEEKTVSV
jgi:hypothetical protein